MLYLLTFLNTLLDYCPSEVPIILPKVYQRLYTKPFITDVKHENRGGVWTFISIVAWDVRHRAKVDDLMGRGNMKTSKFFDIIYKW